MGPSMDEGSRDLTRCFELLYFFVTGAADARMASAAGRWTLRGNAHLKEHVPTVQTRSPRAGCCGSLSVSPMCVQVPTVPEDGSDPGSWLSSSHVPERMPKVLRESREGVSVALVLQPCNLKSSYGVLAGLLSFRLLGSHIRAGPQAIRR